MDRFGSAAALLLLVGAPILGLAQDPSPATRRLDLGRLIELLDSDDFATREQATRDLIALGEDGRQALLAIRGSGSLERQLRIAQIIQGIGARSASRPVRREPTRVTLEVEEKRLSEIAAMLAAQTGYPIRTAPGFDPVLSLSVKDLPFLEAVDLAAAKASARFGWDQQRRFLAFEPSSDKVGPTTYAGPLRISVLLVNVTRQIRFGGPGGTPGNASLQIRVDAEDRSQALGILMPLRVKEVVDDRKRPLKGPEFPQSQSYPSRFDQRRQLISFLQLALPESDAKAIARLEVSLPVLFPTELYEAELQNPETGAESGQGEFHVTVQELKEDGAKKKLSLLITRPALMAGSQAGMTLAEDSVTLVGPDDDAIQPEQSQLNQGTVNSVYTASFPAATVLAAIRVSCVKQYETVEFPVIFENIALP
jgi:hypothetical protein